MLRTNLILLICLNPSQTHAFSLERLSGLYRGFWFPSQIIRVLRPWLLTCLFIKRCRSQWLLLSVQYPVLFASFVRLRSYFVCSLRETVLKRVAPSNTIRRQAQNIAKKSLNKETDRASETDQYCTYLGRSRDHDVRYWHRMCCICDSDSNQASYPQHTLSCFILIVLFGTQREWYEDTSESIYFQDFLPTRQQNTATGILPRLSLLTVKKGIDKSRTWRFKNAVFCSLIIALLHGLIGITSISNLINSTLQQHFCVLAISFGERPLMPPEVLPQPLSINRTLIPPSIVFELSVLRHLER